MEMGGGVRSARVCGEGGGGGVGSNHITKKKMERERREREIVIVSRQDRLFAHEQVIFWFGDG